jgi:hypothetical protein
VNLDGRWSYDRDGLGLDGSGTGGVVPPARVGVQAAHRAGDASLVVGLPQGEALEAMRQRAEAVRRGETRVASAEEIRARARRWREEMLPLLQAEEYPTLLCDGAVGPAEAYCDEDEWFAGIRARAEADGLRVALVHSWSSRRDDEVEP